MSIFEKAARTKLRFAYKGQITSEDLWDLPLEGLDFIYSKLRAEQKAEDGDSLLRKGTREGKVRDLKIALVKHVVETRQAEDEARKNRASIKLQKDKIAGIIAKKQDESLENLSVEELKKQMEALEA